MHTRAFGDFAAYAQNLRRGQLFGLLDAMQARRPQPDILDLLFGGDLARQDLDDAPPAGARRGLSNTPEELPPRG